MQRVGWIVACSSIGAFVVGCATTVDPAASSTPVAPPGGSAPRDAAVSPPTPQPTPPPVAPPATPPAPPPSGAGGACAAADLATLTPCCEANGGGAHCLPDGDVPAELRDDLEACPTGGRCVIDALITSRFASTPRPCTSIGGAAGACVSLCIPQVAMNARFLMQDVCGANERCAPCTNPLDGTSTGICDPSPPLECMSVSPGAPTPPPPPPPPPPMATSCCGGRATCVASEVVPAEHRARLAQDSCSADQLCIPTELLTDPTPRPCTIAWLAFFGDGSGACVSECIPEVGSQPLLSQEDCDPGFKCAPCVDPLSGMPTGLCG